MSKNKLRIMSDIHIEFGDLDVPVLEGEDEQILVLAGDVAPITQHIMIEFMDEMCFRFKHVVMIAGNHEYYSKGSVVNSNVEFEQIKSDHENFHFLQNEMIVLDDIIFMGAVLWTDFNDGDPIAMNNARYGMNDFVHILYNEKPFSPANWIAENKISRDYLWDRLEEFKDDPRKKVVITHHLPSFKSISPQFYNTRGAELNSAYASDNMEEWLAMADLWVHGHTHVSLDYELRDCRVLCNPRGYVRYEENPDFDPELIVEL